ncbi:MAG: hypothetical protein H0U54_07600 [Acidobacteria bacterium]|nr:hypothetical protein [Acidobacteriota bacterium]
MKLILTIAFCFLAFSNTLADSARKFDEYADLPFSEERARLDNLGIQLKMMPDEVGWYFIFAGSKSCPGEARRRAIRAKNYIVKKHGIRADRVIWVDEGYREELTVEMWIWPRSAGKPYPTNSSTLNKNEVQDGMKCKSKSHKPQRRIKM